MDEERLIEAALFVSAEPISAEEIARITGIEKDRIKAAVERLRKEYEERGSALQIKEIGEAHFYMQAKDAYAGPLMNLVRPAVSGEMLKTLSFIAFRQPVTQAEAVKARGYKVYDHVKELENKGFIAAEPHGRTKVLTTTKKFADYFGLAEDLAELKKRMGEMLKGEGIAAQG